MRLGNLGLSSFQNQIVNKVIIIPAIMCCKSNAPDITIQNINKEANEINDFLNTTIPPLRTNINTKKR